MLYLLLTTCLVGLTLAGVPSFIPVCGKRNPKLNECVITTVNSLKGHLAEGIPSLDVPSLSELKIDTITLADEPTFKAVAQNVKLYGFPGFKIKSFNIDLEKQRFDCVIHFETIRLQAEYDVAVRVLVPIAGKGPVDIVTGPIEAKATLKYKLVKHKGKNYMFFNEMSINLDIKDYTSKFTPRGAPDDALAEGINAALSGDRQGILKTITPNLEKRISEVILGLANKVCKNFSYDELFPDRE